ncbi:MAG: hypothetical protein BWY75_03619 [bacterium ADurb.Bin425]|nr:MAG: hypothetical protein BWY75_03619 [bacterium ADurb.Bin425]
MHVQYLLAALDVGAVDYNLPVKATWSKQSRVEDVGTVGGGNNDDAGTAFKAVHFHQ